MRAQRVSVPAVSHAVLAVRRTRRGGCTKLTGPGKMGKMFPCLQTLLSVTFPFDFCKCPRSHVNFLVAPLLKLSEY